MSWVVILYHEVSQWSLNLEPYVLGFIKFLEYGTCVGVLECELEPYFRESLKFL